MESDTNHGDGKRVEKFDEFSSIPVSDEPFREKESLGSDCSRVLEENEIDRNGTRNFAEGGDLSLTQKPECVDGSNCKVLGHDDGEEANLKSKIEPFDKSNSDFKVDPDKEVGDVLGSIAQRTRNRVVKGKKEEVKDTEIAVINSELNDYYDETEFSLGDFVWGKIKSYPWWPGRIYDPSNASEFAMRYKHEGRLLVAYFGDRTFAWCDPSQLKPFEEDFEKMSKKSSLKNFVNAVNVAVNEYCHMLQITKLKTQTSLPLVENAGIKEGVHVSLDGTDKFSDIEFDPKVMLDEIRSFSQTIFVNNMLELGVLKTYLSAFYHSKGGYSLPVYYEPLGIEDLEEKDSITISGFARGPDWCEIPGDNIPETPNGKLRKKRKVKSMVELLGLETKVASKSRKRKQKFVDDDKTGSTTKDEGESGKMESKSGWKKRSVNNGDLSHTENSVTTRSSSRKKAKENGRGENDKRKTKRFPKDGKLSISVGVENGHMGVEELQGRISPREKKVSKYLSPPYTNTSQLQMQRSFGLVQNGHVTKASRKLAGFPPIAKCSVEKSSEGSRSPDEVLCELRSAARDPRKVKSFDTNEQFLSSYRSANYQNGSDYNMYKKQKADHKKRKKNSSNSQGKSLDKNENTSTKPESEPLTVIFIKQKFEEMNSMLAQTNGKMSEETKSNLEDNVKELLKKVKMMTGTSSSTTATT